MGDVTDLAFQREAYGRALDHALDRLRHVFAELPEVRRAIVFGSYAMGRRDLATDLDVLVEMESPLDFVTRTARLYPRVAAGVDLDLFVYTPAEIERMSSHGFVRRALEEGVVIYEKDAR